MGPFDSTIPSISLPSAYPAPSPALQLGSVNGGKAQPQPQQQQPAVPSDEAALAQKLDEALKNSGVKAEIQNERSGQMIVRLVDSDTGKVLIQMPPQAVLDMVADIDRTVEREERIIPQGTLAERLAEQSSSGLPLFDQLA